MLEKARRRPGEVGSYMWLIVLIPVVATPLPLILSRIPVIATILAQPGTAARLAAPQAFRVVGVVFILATALGELPAVFAIPAGLGDIAVGVAAPFVARRLAQGRSRRGAVWFNVLGILDLVVAVGLGVLAGLGPARVIVSEPSTMAATVLPLVLIPTTVVPLALALHVMSLRRLRRRDAVAPVATEPVGAGTS
jgi:hypothetical protein